MAEMNLETGTVNQFISSLSKSIQALCHGYVDFNSSIEMIGYININIDSGKVLDCVLNEKVNKSTANSITCISNSFNAKKEKPKQTQEASCSPVRHHEYTHPKSPSRRQHSNYSYMQREGETGYSGKRASALGGSPMRKKQRRFHKPVTGSSYDYYSNQGTPYQEQSYSSTYPEESTNPPSDSLEQVQNIKTEIPENSDFDHTCSTTPLNVPVKNETDEKTGLDKSEDFALDSNLAGSDSSSQIFPQNSETDESATGVRKQDESSAMKESEPNDESYFESQDDPGPSYSQAREDETNEDSQSQFDVIEIGDDDEDVQGMFNHPDDIPRPGSLQNCLLESSTPRYSCHFCGFETFLRLTFKTHIQLNHPNAYPFKCKICSKGFMTQSGLNLHVSSHAGRNFVCTVCGRGFFQKGHLKGHMKKVHRCAECQKCKTLFKLEEFPRHLLNCTIQDDTPK